eukprot:jgi/Tetstr1/435344/TSEL_024262.t1
MCTGEELRELLDADSDDESIVAGVVEGNPFEDSRSDIDGEGVALARYDFSTGTSGAVQQDASAARANWADCAEALDKYCQRTGTFKPEPALKPVHWRGAAAAALAPRPPARGPPAATPEVQAAAAPPHRSGRGRGKCKLPADLDDDAFMRTAEEVDPDMPRDQAAEEDPPRDVPEGFTPCSVLPCRVGELIEAAKSQHRCRTCQGHFHAMCAAAANGSEDPNDCGCGKLATASPGKTTAVSISPPGEEQVPQALLPPNAMRGQNDLLLAWKEGAEINSLARKPPKGFDQAMSEAWYQAKDARRKCRNAEAQRKRRGGGRTAGKDATDAAGNDSPHDANPEYRAAAGKAPIAEATGSRVPQI